MDDSDEQQHDSAGGEDQGDGSATSIDTPKVSGERDLSGESSQSSSDDGDDHTSDSPADDDPSRVGSGRLPVADRGPRS